MIGFAIIAYNKNPNAIVANVFQVRTSLARIAPEPVSVGTRKYPEA